jgi:hypothetical protein
MHNAGIFVVVILKAFGKIVRLGDSRNRTKMKQFIFPLIQLIAILLSHEGNVCARALPVHDGLHGQNTTTTTIASFPVEQQNHTEFEDRAPEHAIIKYRMVERRAFLLPIHSTVASSSGSSFLEDMKLGIKWTIGGEAHFYRNMNNQYLSFGDAQRQWNLQPDWKSKLHRIGAGNEGNLKFVSPDGHYENVFTPSGRQVWDPRNLGTYNYGTNWASHFLQDMVPYYLLGNSINDPTNVLQRIGGSF